MSSFDKITDLIMLFFLVQLMPALTKGFQAFSGGVSTMGKGVSGILQASYEAGYMLGGGPAKAEAQRTIETTGLTGNEKIQEAKQQLDLNTRGGFQKYVDILRNTSQTEFSILANEYRKKGLDINIVRESYQKIFADNIKAHAQAYGWDVIVDGWNVTILTANRVSQPAIQPISQPAIQPISQPIKQEILSYSHPRETIIIPPENTSMKVYITRPITTEAHINTSTGGHYVIQVTNNDFWVAINKSSGGQIRVYSGGGPISATVTYPDEIVVSDNPLW